MNYEQKFELLCFVFLQDPHFQLHMRMGVVETFKGQGGFVLKTEFELHHKGCYGLGP